VFTVVTDKLEILLKGRIPDNSFLSKDYGLFLIRNHNIKNPLFEECHNLILEGEALGNIFIGKTSQSRFQTAYPVLLSIHNHILYQQNYPRKIEKAIQLMQPVVFEKFYKLDIAIDGQNLIDEHNRLMNSSIFKRKRKVLNSAILDDDSKSPISSRLGSLHSDKYISMYNKTLEIEKSKKEYIKEFWRLNGMNYEQIDRIEGRMKMKELVNFGALTQIDNPNYLLAFFKQKFDGYLEFVHKNDKTKTKGLIDWSLVNNINIEKNKLTKKAPDSVYSSKVAAKCLHILFRDTGQDCFKESLNLILDNNNMNSWYIKKSKHW
jgi:hypothetical protein